MSSRIIFQTFLCFKKISTGDNRIVLIAVSRETEIKLHFAISHPILHLSKTIPTERPPLLGEVSANFCG
jgi:hypothetical protein